MLDIFQNMLNKEIKPYRCGPLKGVCLQGFENLDIASIPFDKHKREYSGYYSLLKRTRSRCTVSFDFTSGEQTHRIYAKRYRVWKFTRRLGYCFIPSKCIREWRLGFALLKKGILTPVPLVAAESRIGPFVKENYLVTLGIEPFEPLNQALKNIQEEITRRKLLENLARFIRSVHENGFYHDDISLDHIYTLQSPGEERRFALIDLDNSRLQNKLSPRLITRNLFQMFLSANPTVLPFEDRHLFLESYVGSSPAKRLSEEINALAYHKTGGSLL
jgi:tRNA A-37 threonylcarbamoyl transferase component Bud32